MYISLSVLDPNPHLCLGSGSAPKCHGSAALISLGTYRTYQLNYRLLKLYLNDIFFDHYYVVEAMLWIGIHFFNFFQSEFSILMKCGSDYCSRLLKEYPCIYRYLYAFSTYLLSPILKAGRFVKVFLYCTCVTAEGMWIYVRKISRCEKVLTFFKIFWLLTAFLEILYHAFNKVCFIVLFPYLLKK